MIRVAERLATPCKVPPLILRAGPRGRDRGHVASGASHLREDLLARANACRDPAAGRRLGGPHEVGKCHDVDAVVLGIRNLVVIGAVADVFTARVVFLGKQGRRDAHFVQVGVRGE